ncbi:MAG: outer membrane protein assembly factor BamA [Ignavibacteriales bacterium]|nr:MAG: outer membrane protein assembly factor BamA [Ignavibacteriales bacterium]
MLLMLQKKSLKYLIVLMIVSALPVIAQVSKASYKVLGVSVEGNKSADANIIIANSGLKVGDEVQIPGDQTLNAIRQLWALNIFSDVQIIIDRQIADGVFLLIKVKEYPRIEKVVVEGNDEIDTEDIEAKSTFIRGQILKPQEVSKLVQNVQLLYEEDGYLNTKITSKYFVYFTADTVDEDIHVTWRNEKDLAEEYTVEYEPGDQTYSNLIDRIKDRILLKLDIEENEKVVVREIVFEGNEAFDDGDLSGEMSETEEAKWWKFWSSAKFDKKKFEEDKELIIKYYKKNGYRDAEILSDSLIYYNNNEDLKIVMDVHEGPQYKVRNIEWEGNTIYSDEVLTERLDFAKGDVFNYEKFEQNLRGNEKQNDIYALYLDNGYLTFNLQPTEKKVGPDSIDISIRLEEKNQFKIGRVDVAGNDKTKGKVIRRELYTVPGDYFNRGLLFRSVQQLANLQFFNVEKLYGPQGIDTKLSSDSTVDITFRVEEKSSDYLNASVGYSGSFGFSGAVGVTLTNFSIAEPFSLGGGQILSFNWQFGVGNYYRTFTLGFTEPWLFDTPTLVGAEVFDTRQRYIYDLRQSGGTVRVGRRLKWPDDFFYVQGFFRYQYNNVIEGQNFYAEGQTQQFTLGATISRKNIDNPIFPSIGSSFSLDAEISGGPFLPGDVDYYKLGFKTEWYKRLFNSNKLVLYAGADIGYLNEIVSGTQIQPFEFYYMGGNGLVIATTPLRGYDDREVGPKNINDDVIGGRLMTKYTAELRFAVALDPIPLYLLAFAEAGNVFRTLDEADLFELRRSVGFGARILINPIGLIGFDLGYGFDRKLTNGKDPAWLFHFQFGRGF